MELTELIIIRAETTRMENKKMIFFSNDLFHDSKELMPRQSWVGHMEVHIALQGQKIFQEGQNILAFPLDIESCPINYLVLVFD